MRVFCSPVYAVVLRLAVADLPYHIPKEFQKRYTYNPPPPPYLSSTTDTYVEPPTSEISSSTILPGTSIWLSTSAPISTGISLSTGPSSFLPSSTARLNATSTSRRIIFSTIFTPPPRSTRTGGTGTYSSATRSYNITSTYYWDTSTVAASSSPYVFPTNPTAPLSTGPSSGSSITYGSSATPPYANTTGPYVSSTPLGTGIGTGTAPIYLSSTTPPYANSTGPYSTRTPFGSTGLPPIPTLTPIRSRYPNSTLSSTTSEYTPPPPINGTSSAIEPTETSEYSSYVPSSTGGTAPLGTGTNVWPTYSTTGYWTNSSTPAPSTTDYEYSSTTDIDEPSTTPYISSDLSSYTYDRSYYTTSNEGPSTIVITITLPLPEEPTTTTSETELPTSFPDTSGIELSSFTRLSSSTATEATGTLSTTSTRQYASYITLTPIVSSTSEEPSSSWEYSSTTSDDPWSTTYDISYPPSTSPAPTGEPVTSIETDPFPPIYPPSSSADGTTNTDATATSSPDPSTYDPYPSSSSEYAPPPTDTDTDSVPTSSSTLQPSTFLTSVSASYSSSDYAVPTLEVRADAGHLRTRWWGWGGERQTEDQKERGRLGRGKGATEDVERKGKRDGEVDNVEGTRKEEGSGNGRLEYGKQTWFGRRVLGMYFL